MHRAVNDLADVVEKQVNNYTELKRLVLEERKAIMANDLKKLSEVTSQIQAVIASNNRLEMGRMSLVKRLASELKLSMAKPTLAHIARRLENPLSEKLMGLRRRANAAITEVQRQARINAEMLKYCVNLMDSVLRGLVDPKPRKATYGSTGEAKRVTASVSLLDHQV